MDQDWPHIVVAHVLQHRQQMVEVVTVDWADIIDAKLLEEGSASPKIAREFLCLAGSIVDELRQMPAKLLDGLAHRAVGAAGGEPRKIGGERAGRRRNRHVVVVQD